MNKSFLFSLSIVILYFRWSLYLFSKVNPSNSSNNVYIHDLGTKIIDTIKFKDYSNYAFVENVNNNDLNKDNKLFLNLHPKFLLMLIVVSLLTTAASGFLIPVFHRIRNRVTENHQSWKILILTLIASIAITSGRPHNKRDDAILPIGRTSHCAGRYLQNGA